MRVADWFLDETDEKGKNVTRVRGVGVGGNGSLPPPEIWISFERERVFAGVR